MAGDWALYVFVAVVTFVTLAYEYQHTFKERK